MDISDHITMAKEMETTKRKMGRLFKTPMTWHTISATETINSISYRCLGLEKEVGA